MRTNCDHQSGFGKFARLILVAAALLFPSHATSQEAALLKELDQGWSSTQRDAWYAATQGSRLIPLVWLRNLEQPGETGLFLEPEHIASFGYLPRSNTAAGPLPVGFVVDRGPDGALQRTRLRWKADQGEREPWVGLSCSACHTSRLTYRGRTIPIDGGPSVTNFQNFMQSLNRALVETRDDPQKWDRFVLRVLPAPANTSGNRTDLKKVFGELVGWQLQEARANATDLTYGPGRIDAFGHIYNKVALLLGGPDAKGNPSDAPVSIPFIWRAPQLDRVQYNGIAPKIPVAKLDIGAIGRNTGEVIGVFGDVVPHKDLGLTKGFKSSIKLRNLVALENVLGKLRPPAWPASVFGKPASVLGKVDTGKLARGETLYNQQCASCHVQVSRKDVTKIIKTEMNLFDGSAKHSKTDKPLAAPGTDIWMACNAFDYRASSGVLTGFESKLLTGGEKLPDQLALGKLLRITVAGTLFDRKWELTQAMAAQVFGTSRLPEVEAAPDDFAVPLAAGRSAEKRLRLGRCIAAKDDNLGYTSRPLNGIWATAPYLHNGSVPTLYDLLLPPDQRPKSFFLGTREYDPVKVGFVTEKSSALGNTFEFKTRDDDGNIIDGNSNEGHDYSNSKLSDEDRFAIIEYLKTL